MQPSPVDTYLQEADELLAEIEAAALSMMGDPMDAETVNRIFRAFHTIKGSGAMFGFDQVAGFTHHVETLLDQVREGAVPVSKQLSNLILAATDHIHLLIRAAQGGAAVDAVAQAGLLNQVRELSVTGKAPGAGVREFADTEPETAAKTWRIQFRPDPFMLRNGGNPLPLFRDLRKLGECVIEGHADRLPRLAELEPGVCYLWWTITLNGKVNAAAIRDVFLFVEDGGELQIEPSPEAGPAAPAKAQHTAPRANVAAADNQSRIAGSQLQPEEAQPKQGQAKEAQPKEAQPREASVRVPAARLDRLVNLVGELVMNQSRLATAAHRFQAPELAAPVEEIERLVAELRDDVLQIRMMPIGTIFGRFRRLVHDLSLQLGKEIELVTEGEETELDKSILDQLAEPLVHLLRNSIDHGIESAAGRLAKGKPRQGTIRLAASHRGSDVVVSIEDDGAGLNRAAIRAKAVAKQIIAADANLSDKEILNLILLPGFSTAQSVTSVSGRGVGMDVVKRQIDALRGSLSLTSEPGRGACVSLTLPLTLAIIDGLLVEAGDSQYIIPMAVVTETVELAESERAGNNRRNLVAVRGELIPYIDLRESFRMEGAGPAISKIVLVRYEEKRVGLVVDRVMGARQTVIQALGRFFRNIHVVSGSTVMGDGRVALILDIAGVVRLAGRHCRQQAGRTVAVRGPSPFAAGPRAAA
jgi:two-component system chemotaxis sensor kinase CheA